MGAAVHHGYGAPAPWDQRWEFQLDHRGLPERWYGCGAGAKGEHCSQVKTCTCRAFYQNLSLFDPCVSILVRSLQERCMSALVACTLIHVVSPTFVPDTMRSTSVFARFSPTQILFCHPVPQCFNSKCIWTHLKAYGHAGLKKEVCSSALLMRCFFEELKKDNRSTQTCYKV